jgi:GNAT superfamily N-acetyltransferase
MWWRRTRSAFDQQKGEQNKHAFHALVQAGDVPGLLAYANEQPIGWCAIAPRTAYLRLEHSRVLKRIDDAPVWSITCLFVARPFRRQGVSVGLLRAAMAFAATRGAGIVEGYPVIPRTPTMPAAFAWTGTLSAFRQAGFVEALRRSQARPIMRAVLGQ